MATKRKSYGPVMKNSPVKRRGNAAPGGEIFGNWTKQRKSSSFRGKHVRSVKQ